MDAKRPYGFFVASALAFGHFFVKFGVDGVEVFGIQVILGNTHGIAEAVTEEWILRYP